MLKDLAQPPPHRQNCTHCLRPKSHCYCALIRKIDSQIMFVILIHPLEIKRKIATGRMAHLCLPNSLLIRGGDFSDNDQVNQIIEDPDNHCLILYPGENAIDLSATPAANPNPVLNDNKRTVVFVIDGTWSTANKTLKRSSNLNRLQRICFTPKTPSQFRVRRQPHPHCHSTIEAIHQIISLLDGSNAAHSEKPAHDVLLEIFKFMVEQQVRFSPGNKTATCAPSQSHQVF